MNLNMSWTITASRTVWLCAGVQRRIPTGFNMHTGARPGMRAVLDDISHRRVPTKYLEGMASQKRAEQQLGTLGGGNHFLEVKNFQKLQCLRDYHSPLV